MKIHISDRTHKFQSKTRLDAKANSELYKSKRVCSAPCVPEEEATEEIADVGERWSLHV